MSPRSPHSLPTRGGLAIPAILTLLVTTGLDVLRFPESMPVRYLLSVAGLAVTFGLVLSIVLDLLLRRLPRIPFLGRMIPFLIGITAGGSLAEALGVFTRLTGRHQALALITGGVCLGGGLGLGVLLLGLQDRRDGSPGWLAQIATARGAGQVALSGALLNGALAALAVDHRMYVGLYPVAHVALRMAACVMGTLALWTARPMRKLGEASIPLLVLSLFVPTALLTGGADDALQAFSLRPFSSTLLHGARRAFDFDGDGFSALLGGGDCDDDNPNVHPAAREIPDNGIDDNCFFGDASKKVVTVDELPKPAGPSPFNVVLITVDTLRWDRLGLNDPHYASGAKDTMPHTSAWGRTALNFTRAYSAGSWTSIALATLTRGVYARRMEWVPHYETNRFRMLKPDELSELRKHEKVEKMFPLAWQDPHPPLSAMLQRRGMHTVAVIDDSFSLMLAREMGCDEGFDLYREVNRGATVRPRFDDEDTVRMAVREVNRAEDKDKPFFLWVHFFGPHGPSTIHDGVRLDSKSRESDRYDHEVRFTDMQLKKLLDALKPIEDHTAIFLTSDHGENIGPNYRSHGTSAEEHMIRVPMLAKVPGWPHGQYTHAVSHVDVVPTILGLTETPAPAGLDGVDLTPYVTGQEPAPHRVLLTDCWGFDKHAEPYVDLVAAYDGHHKLVLDRRDNGFSRFVQDHFSDEVSHSADLLAGPLMNTVMGYVEETGGAIHMTVPALPPEDADEAGEDEKKAQAAKDKPALKRAARPAPAPRKPRPNQVIPSKVPPPRAPNAPAAVPTDAGKPTARPQKSAFRRALTPSRSPKQP